jgi:hypothetical protein
MAYTPPARSTLRASVARDLRDPDYKTFTSQELDDLLNFAIVEVGRIYPKQGVVDMALSQDYQSAYTTQATNLFRVEIVAEDYPPVGIPPNNYENSGQAGWDLHAGTLYIPYSIAQRLSMTKHSLRIWGYWARELLYSDAETLDGDAEAEFAVRMVATLNGYQRLQNDRLLYQQWLTNTGNSDVSPNQLAQTADMYQSQWREMRNRLRTLRRA